MAYTTKTSLIARPGHTGLGLDVGGAVSDVVQFFGAGIKAQGAEEALAAQLKAQQAAQSSSSTPLLVIGGLAVVGLLVFAMRRK